MNGRVLQVNVKGPIPGRAGLPKFPVPRARVSVRGVEGDFNRYRTEQLDGDLDSAVLIVPIETLESLNQEGWPIRPGDLGENLTTRGIPQDQMESAQRFSVGTSLIRLTRRCDPCRNLYELPFVGETRGPEFLRTMVGRRGWYAGVEREGEVSPGDPIALLNPK